MAASLRAPDCHLHTRSYLLAILAVAYIFRAIMRSSVYSLVLTLAIFWDGNSQIGPIFYRTGCRVSNENTTAIRYRNPRMTSIYEKFDWKPK
jgi:hypothetical protein